VKDRRALHRRRVGCRQEHLFGGLHLAEHVAAHRGVELREGVVEQQDGRRARGLGDRHDLGQAQRQRDEALLPARAKRARVDAVELDREIVAMRADQRQAPAQLLTLPVLERRQERGRLGRLAERRSVPDFHLGPRAREGRVHARELRLQSRHRLPAAPEQLHPDRRKLLVPRLELRHVSGIVSALLEEPVAAREDLAEPQQRRDVIRIEPSGEPVDEIAARHRSAVDDLEILPAERDNTRPLRRRLARALPGPVFEPVQRPPDRPLRFAANEVAHEG
jgi:hypothetical protein